MGYTWEELEYIFEFFYEALSRGTSEKVSNIFEHLLEPVRSNIYLV